MNRAAWPWPRLLAHRGGGRLAPENTLAALACGRAHGYRGVEFDAMLAADGVAVLMHDETLDRTTDGHGPVARRSAAELARLDAGGWFARRYAGEPVPSLAQALDCCRALGLWANVEIKPGPGAEALTGARVALEVASRWPADPGGPGGAGAPLLSSFATVALEAARAAAPHLARGLLFDRIPDDWRATMDRLGCRSLHCNHRHLSPARAAAVRDAGYGLLCYTVDEPARVRELRDWGVDACCTDRVDLVDPARP